jgi:transcriptional regulator with XRE-family HTH domain
MQIATLGGLIKDHRLKKRLSQLEVSLRIGWSDATRLSKIEQGRVSKPTRKTLDKIMDALELDVHQRGEMLRVGAAIPSKEEAKEVISKLEESINFFNCPVLLIDIYWNTYFVNKHFQELWNMPDESLEYIKQKYPNWMELLFLTKYLNNSMVQGGYKESSLLSFYEYQVAHFKFELKEYFSETWFQKLLKSLKESTEFSELWNKMSPIEIEDHQLYDYEFNRFMVINNDEKMQLSFHVFSVRPTADARFYFMVHVPADGITSDFYN